MKNSQYCFDCATHSIIFFTLPSACISACSFLLGYNKVGGSFAAISVSSFIASIGCLGAGFFKGANEPYRPHDKQWSTHIAQQRETHIERAR